MALFDQIKSRLATAASQIGQAGSEVQAEMQLDRVRRWIAETPPDVTPQKIIESLRQIVKVDSRIAPEAHRLLAEQLASNHEMTQARHHLQAAIDLMSADVPVTTREWIVVNLGKSEDEYLCDLYNDLATLQYTTQQWQPAMEAAQKAVESNDHDLTAYHTWAASLLAMGQSKQAERVLHRARTFDNLGLVDAWIEEFQRVGLIERGEAPGRFPTGF